MTALPPSLDHQLLVLSSAGERGVVTSFPRGQHTGHRLLCGACDVVLAWDHCPMPRPAPALRCSSCKTLNDPTQSRSPRAPAR